jgi:hypothetical protein
LQAVPLQASAAPFHDWNSRIAAECYRPNGASRVVDGSGRIRRILNNYARMSFDIGPTLMSWLSEHAPDVLAALIAADQAAVARWGHGVAMAQAYNHTILPLSNLRDRRTQVRWGLTDFSARFGRPAEGLWLPECAVDTQTLEILAEEGVKYTILAPRQVRAVAGPGEDFVACGPDGPDPRVPYRVELPSGRHLAVFLYDGPTSQAVAFERLLDSGDRFAERLRTLPQRPHHLGNIATDGESYGHHHRFGDMALAWALERLDGDPDIQITPYASFLARYPPTHRARIVENSSWSCAHGVERWRGPCGCGAPPHQLGWRAPLRSALERLGDRLDEVFADRSRGVLRNPWAARDAWVSVLLDSTLRARFDQEHVEAGADPVAAAELLEMQRHRMLMFTSCAWFFDDLDRLEPQRNLAYAWRAAELAERVGEMGVQQALMADLGRIASGRADGRDAATLIHQEVLPEVFSATRAAAHHAAGALAVPDAWGGAATDRWYAFDLVTTREIRRGPSVVRCVDVHERPTGRITGVVTASWSGPGEICTCALEAAAVPDPEVLLDAWCADRSHVSGRAVARVDGVADLLEADRVRVQRAATVNLEHSLNALGQTWRVWAPLLPDPDAPGAPVPVSAAAWAYRHAALSALLQHPGPVDAAEALALGRQVAGAPGVALLQGALDLGLAALVDRLRPDDPGTVEVVCARVALARRLGLTPDLFSAQNRVYPLLIDPRARAAPWVRARTAARTVLALDPG